jgi:hypothetical protein
MSTPSVEERPEQSPWPTFEDILHRLHQEGILIHPHQLAEFFLMHGLPVDLCYVPNHLQQKAAFVNNNYMGDMAQLKKAPVEPWYSYPLV